MLGRLLRFSTSIVALTAAKCGLMLNAVSNAISAES